ncbi:MAG: GAF domain-containing protein [Coleofasciculaceae cyanobacterium]
MSNQPGLELILSDTLTEVVQQCKNLIGVDRSTIFLLDPEDAEVVSVMSSDFGQFREFHITASSKIKSKTDFFNKIISDSFDFHDSFDFNQQHGQQKYIIYNVLSVPVINCQGDLIAVLQVLNKLKSDCLSQASLPERIDLEGFKQQDEHQLNQLSKTSRSTVERCQSLYREIKKQRAVLAFIKAIHAISKGGFDQDAILKLIMDEAKALINADRSRLWLIDVDSPTALARAEERELRISQWRQQKLQQGRQARLTNGTSQLNQLRNSQTTQPKFNYRQLARDYEKYYKNGCFPPEQVLFPSKTLTMGTKLGKSQQEIETLNAIPQEKDKLEEIHLDNREAKQNCSCCPTHINQATEGASGTINSPANQHFIPSSQRQKPPTRRGDLWTKIFRTDGSFREIRIPIDFGFVGQVAQSGQPINICFDIYDHPNSRYLKKLDKKMRYRTCSLLCLPIFNANNQVIAVMELVNKKKLGNFSKYNFDNWPSPPEAFQASFSYSAQQLMTAFTIQVGVALQNCQVLGSLKQQEKIQQDLLQNLGNGVIYTDKAGRIVTINESASKLLKRNKDEHLLGCQLDELIALQELDLSRCLQSALAARESQDLRQYHPGVTLIAAGGKEYKINLSINLVGDTSNGSNIQGALVIIDDFR